MVVWLEPLVLAAGVGTVTAAGLALGWRAAGEPEEAARWGRRAAGAGMLVAALAGFGLALGAFAPALDRFGPALGGGGQPEAADARAAAETAGTVPGAPAPRQLDPAAAAETRAFLRQRYRPVLEQLGPLLDTYVAGPEPGQPGAVPGRAAGLAAGRDALAGVQARLAALEAEVPPPARVLVQRTWAVLGALERVLEAEAEALAGRPGAAAALAAARRDLAEQRVEPWLFELLELTAASGAAGDG